MPVVSCQETLNASDHENAIRQPGQRHGGYGNQAAAGETANHYSRRSQISNLARFQEQQKECSQGQQSARPECRGKQVERIA